MRSTCLESNRFVCDFFDGFLKKCSVFRTTIANIIPLEAETGRFIVHVLCVKLLLYYRNGINFFVHF